MTDLTTDIIETIAIDSRNASIGMYVSLLDRPWLETPFVFQGFEIKDRADVELLQSYCSFLYIDVKRSGLTRLQVMTLQESKSPRSRAGKAKSRRKRIHGKWLLRLRDLLLKFGVMRQRKTKALLGKDGYESTSTMRGEAPKAFAAYKALLSQYHEVTRFAQKNGRLPTGVLNKVVPAFVESILRNPDAMAWTIFSRRDRGGESRAVATSAWCVMFGRHLGFDRDALTDLAIGGLLLDIGNIRVSAEILNVEGELTEQQYAALSKHVVYGLDILRASGGGTQNVRDMLEYHHERADGSGYPKGVMGNKIPAYGRIAAIADAYDAMTTSNAYSPAYGAFDVARTLNEMRGEQFAAEVVEQFLCTVGMFPTASVVELNNGTVGLVLEQNRENALRPKVMVLLDRDHKLLDKSEILQMRDLPPDATHAAAVWIAQGHEHGAFGIDPKNFFTASN